MAKNLILLIFSLSSTLLVSEVALRYVLEAWPFETALFLPEYLTEREATLQWRFSPTDGRNSLGLRNREVGQKQPGTYRILFLGDSLFWNSETRSGELYTNVLERRLNARSPQTPPTYEVINAGIPGYTTYQELEFLKLHGLDMQPDMVVLGFVLNDVYYKYLHKPTAQRLLDREPPAMHRYRFDSTRFPGTLFARSYLAHKVVERSQVLWQMIRQRPIFPFERRYDFHLAWKSYGWNDAQRLIGEMQTLLTERAIRFAIVVFPLSDQVEEQYRQLDEAYVLYPQDRIRQICDDYEIPSLDLTPAIYQNGGPTLFRDYPHLNAAGNDVAADELEKFLIERLRR